MVIDVRAMRYWWLMGFDFVKPVQDLLLKRKGRIVCHSNQANGSADTGPTCYVLRAPIEPPAWKIAL